MGIILKLYLFTLLASNALNIEKYLEAIIRMRKEYKIVKIKEVLLFGFTSLLTDFFVSLIPLANIILATVVFFKDDAEKYIVDNLLPNNIICKKGTIKTLEENKKEIDNSLKERKNAINNLEKINDELNSKKTIVNMPEEELSKLSNDELKETLLKDLNHDKNKEYKEKDFINSLDNLLKEKDKLPKRKIRSKDKGTK